MNGQRKVTVHVPADLPEKAQKASGQGITETVTKGLRLIAARDTFRLMSMLRGRVKFSVGKEVPMGAVENSTRRAVAAALVSALSILTVDTLARVPEPTFVAVVRSDGSLIPVAEFDGREWWDRWPTAEQSEDKLPAMPPTGSLAVNDWIPPGMHFPVVWQVYLGRGRTRQVHALRAIHTKMLEEHVIGIQTDFRGRPSDDSALAISGPGLMGGFSGASSLETTSISRQLAELLKTLELGAIAHWREEHAIPSDVVQKLRRVFWEPQRKTPSPFSLLRAEQPFKGQTYYYLTGEKLYDGFDPAIPQCMMNLSFDGVVTTNSSRQVISEKVSAFAFSEYCGDSGSTAQFIGTVQVGDQFVWLAVDQLEDGFSYFLKDPKGEIQLPQNPSAQTPIAVAKRTAVGTVTARDRP